MANKLYPLLFKPVYKSHIWGGTRIAERFARAGTHTPCAESWEIADRPEGESLVTNGPLAGRSLHDLVASMKRSLVGTDCKSSVFPLLIKVLDAQQRLSVQVHPDTNSAAAHGGEPKTEMWYVLAAEPGARLFTGLKPGTSAESFLKAVEQDRVEELLGSVPAKAGTAVFVPGGLVHAIGEGCLLLEVQQNSDTTHRVYDWKRVGKDGKPREMHIERAMKVINWDLGTPAVVKPRKTTNIGGNSFWEVLTCPFFRISRADLSKPAAMTNDGRSFHALFIVEGRIQVEGNGVAETLGPGTSCLLPAGLKRYTLTPVGGPAAVISTSLV
jgi:mannose-6-phosphate isomerase